MKFGESLSEGLVPEWKDQYVQYKLGKKHIKSIAGISDQLSSQKPTDTTPLIGYNGADALNQMHGSYEESHADLQNPGKGQTNQKIPEADGVGGSLQVPTNAHKNPGKNPGKGSRKTSVKESMKSLFLHFSGKSLNEAFEEEKQDFLHWLDDELCKVDGFYKEKEKNVYTRFLLLEDQFFQLKEHKATLAHISKLTKSDEWAVDLQEAVDVELSRWFGLKSFFKRLSRYELPSLPLMAFLDNFRSQNKKDGSKADETKDSAGPESYDVHYRENQIRNGKLDVESDFDDEQGSSLPSEQSLDALEDRQRSSTVTPTILNAQQLAVRQREERRKDYVKKKRYGVPYYYARKQLKDALVEHYRSIALIRSYRTMNRTAFRKITKKFDKATGCSISGEFMKKVDKEAYFQTSVTLDQVLTRVEDLFLTFYDSEKTDRKHGLEKLRSATYAYNNSGIRGQSYYSSTFLLGLLLGIALPFLGIAIYVAFHLKLAKSLLEGKMLLQIWCGFFFINLSMFLIGINFLVYTKFKVNYKFIFEFNLANALDCRQYFLLPSLGFGLLGAFAWISFEDFWPNKLPGRVWPLIYLACVLIIFLWPGRQLYPASRQWLQIALWRIVCSGWYPVEFRDFYLGDVLCSLTYSMSNLSFFICLYANKWRHVLGGGDIPSDSAQCGSRHSRLMGFLSTLPYIWRFLQCLRRYMDTGDAFPHLANMTKYSFSMVANCLLSIWRIDQDSSARAAYITFASINSVFSGTWDIVMDWSLGLTSSKNFLLRDHLFFERPEYYYIAMVLDVVLRFQWIFYAFFSAQIQQLAVTSFCIALAELLRRFIWMFFRMENEHCANVILFRASRDLPLPYMVSSRVERAIKKLVDLRYNPDGKVSDDDELSTDNTDTQYDPRASSITAKPPPDEASIGQPSAASSKARSRRKSTFMAITSALNKAHVKDFQRKKFAVQAEESEDDEDIDDDVDQTSEREA